MAEYFKWADTPVLDIVKKETRSYKFVYETPLAIVISVALRPATGNHR